jgi:hypothetical protein
MAVIVFSKLGPEIGGHCNPAGDPGNRRHAAHAVSVGGPKAAALRQQTLMNLWHSMA